MCHKVTYWFDVSLFWFFLLFSRSNALSFIGIFCFLIKMVPLSFISSWNLLCAAFPFLHFFFSCALFSSLLDVFCWCVGFFFQTSYSLLICSLNLFDFFSPEVNLIAIFQADSNVTLQICVKEQSVGRG